MKIIELRAANVKRLSAVQINPAGNVVVVGGKNGQGKSSLLDSIVYALSGASSLPGQPVRKGEEHAEITIKLDSSPQLIIRRRIREGGKTDLEIRQVSDEGIAATVKSPQTLLDALCGTIAFDPLAFTRLRPNDQVDVLRRLVGVDVSDLDREIGQLGIARAEVKRDAKRFAEELAQLPQFDDMPTEEQSAAEVLERLDALQRANQLVARRQTDLVEARVAADKTIDSVMEATNRVAELTAELRRATEQLKSLQDKANAQTVAADALADELAKMVIVDDSEIRKELAGLEELNAKIRANKAYDAADEKLKAAESQVADQDEQLAALRGQRIDRINAAAWPVEGMGFGDDGVTLNGLPFEQCSSAEQLTISTAIGLAQHPKLRVLLIRDGSLLDEDAMATVAELAAKHDAQVWIERVGRGEECTVVIEDGAIASTVEA